MDSSLNFSGLHLGHNMNILLIGFRYHEIEEIQERLLVEFPQLKSDFAISLRDSWYRLKISFYDLIILDATCSEIDSLITYEEISIRGNGIPIVLLVSKNEIEKISRLNENRPKFTFAKEDNYLEELIAMLKKGEESAVDMELHHQLQLNEDKLRVLQYFYTSINSMHDSLFIVNSQFKIMEVNNAFLEEFQTTRKEVIGKSCYQIIHQLPEPCDEANWTCPLREVFRLGMPYQGSINQSEKSSNGSQKMTVKATPIRSKLNQVDEIVITFHKEAHTARAQTHAIFNKSLLELMLSGLSDGLLFCNSENKILLLNQVAETILGIPKAKIIDKSIFNLPLGDGANWLKEVLNGLKKDMRFNSMAFKTRINNYYIQIRFAPIFGQENYYLGGFLYLTEVEEGSKADIDQRQFILNDKIFDVLHLTSPIVIAEG